MIKFAYTILYVQDVGKTINFYEKAFGFERKFISPDNSYGELLVGETTLSFASVALANTNLKDLIQVNWQILQTGPAGKVIVANPASKTAQVDIYNDVVSEHAIAVLGCAPNFATPITVNPGSSLICYTNRDVTWTDPTTPFGTVTNDFGVYSVQTCSNCCPQCSVKK